MPAIHETAYPRLKRSVTPAELTQMYTPTAHEIVLAARVTKGRVARLGFLVLLKTFQRLGYFVLIADVPEAIITHIAATIHLSLEPTTLLGYDTSGTRARHVPVIRAHVGVQPFGPPARRVLLRVLLQAAQTKEEVVDLINIGIEELVRQRYELPVFPTLMRAAQHIRALTHRRLYTHVATTLGAALCAHLDMLFAVDPQQGTSPWDALKREPGHPTLTHLRDLLDRLTWFGQWPDLQPALAALPEVKVRHFAAEANTLDAARMLAMEPNKRVTLGSALLRVRAAQARDDLAEMFIKRMLTIHHKAQAALIAYQATHQQQTDQLIATLRELLVAYQGDGDPIERWAAMNAVIQDQGPIMLAACESHLMHSGNTYYPFLWAPYRSHRATLFRILQTLSFTATSQDTTFVQALQFLRQHEHSKGEWLPVLHPNRCDGRTRWVPAVDLSWVPDGWWRLLTGQYTSTVPPRQINRRHFEVCVFTVLMQQLKAGNVAIAGSDAFADYRDQLIDWSEYQRTVAAYGQMLGFPTDGAAFVTHLQHQLAQRAATTDAAFPSNHLVRLERGEPVITRTPKAPDPPGLATVEAVLRDRLAPVTILDVLNDTEHWLHWTQPFGPISGHAGKLDDPRTRYVATTFCYGCNLGPSQAARGLPMLDRRQFAWANQRHITEEALEQASRRIINAYYQFALPRYWGSGKHAAADGTKWDVYERNLLSEYHIRYGGYGGIGYYHVSDTYIALFSHFIPCGVWEAVYILDGLLKNESDIQPDTIHADTQGQSAPVFGLAMLLGISLMPRIRNWQRLTLFRPTATAHYTHIDSLFGPAIDWKLIATHLPDMLRVVLSIKAGRINASTILRRLSSYNAQNRLYQAFRELGRVVRTDFLLRYVADANLRTVIHAATNKNESFNRFAQWLAFGGEGIIAENDRAAQRKIIKYNQLVANCVIFYNVVTISRVLRELQQAGQVIDGEVIAALSPYLTHHIDRFGRYTLDPDRQPLTLEADLYTSAWLPTASDGHGDGTGGRMVAHDDSQPRLHVAQLPLDGIG